VAEDEIERSPMERTRQPIVPLDPQPALRADEMAALVKATEGQTFNYRRDRALLMLLFDTGMR
jgi:integrase/recombinase XerC